mgnify:CR=1 FL=1
MAFDQTTRNRLQRFVNDARRVLEDMWGNPPDDSVLGMIVPRRPGLSEQDSWAVVVTWSDDGYVSDEDASKIDYADLLKTMQAETRDSNPERIKAGYGSLDLVGWAVPPRRRPGCGSAAAPCRPASRAWPASARWSTCATCGLTRYAGS